MADTGKFMRLRRAIESVLSDLDDNQAVIAGKALWGDYQRLRKEVLSVVPRDNQKEFDRLFPENLGLSSLTPMEKAEKYHRAKGLLSQLGG